MHILLLLFGRAKLGRVELLGYYLLTTLCYNLFVGRVYVALCVWYCWDDLNLLRERP
jgi:hypothetical protein